MGTTPPITTNNPQNTRSTKPDQANPSGADIIGFFPLFAFIFMGPVNTLGFVTGIMGVALTPKAKTVVGWLGLLLNAAPYVAFVATIWLIP